MKEAVHKSYKIQAKSYESPGKGWIPSAHIMSADGGSVTVTPMTWYPQNPINTQNEADAAAIQSAKEWIDRK